MRYRIAGEVFRDYPGYVRGVVVARACHNSAGNPALLALLRQAEKAVHEDPAWENLSAHPRVSAWRAAFSRFGATPSKYPSSVEAILKRAHRGDELPYVNDLVALGTYLTLRHALPIGGHDLALVQGDLLLAESHGSEQFVPLGGGPVEHPEPGEVIYRDAVKVLCRRWVWRQADEDKITLDTRELEINVDGLPPATEAEVCAAMAECSRLIAQVTGGSTRELLLNAANPEVEL